MELFSFWPVEHRAALLTAGTLLLGWLAWRLRTRKSSSGGNVGSHRQLRSEVQDALDTVAGWPPEPARVLNRYERQAMELLRSAAPGRIILAQVPLTRFLRVPTRNSYSQWLSRVGMLNADLLLCDTDGRVRVVVDVRSAQESPRSRQRHDRMRRVLRAAGIHVCVWRENALPRPLDARAEIAALLPAEASAQEGAAAGGASRPMPLIPVPEIAELLAEYEDSRGALPSGFIDFDAAAEPVPSTFFSELDEPASEAKR